MYDPLARHFEDIFPVSENQIEFVRSTLQDRAFGGRHRGQAKQAKQAGRNRPQGQSAAPTATLRLLDVGCAIGDLSAAVVSSGSGSEPGPSRTSRTSLSSRASRAGFLEASDALDARAASSPDKPRIDRVIEADAIDLNSAMIQRAAARHSEIV